MIRRLATLALLALLAPLALAGCGDKSAATGAGDEAEAGAEAAGEGAAAAVEGAAASAKIFDEELRKKPCELLTKAMVAKVAGVGEDALEVREISGMCLYEWEAGNASLGFVRVKKSAEMAATYFANAHMDMSGEEVAAAFDKIGDEAKKKLEEDAEDGEAKAAPEHVKPVTKAMGGAFAGGMQFEAVDGLGDAAFYEKTRTETELAGKKFVSYANKLDVLVGNMSFGVTFSLNDEPDAAKMYKDENVALARAVVDALP
ncbi:MAG: hypothetical protein KC486_19805 [Myxococcales bacterium]|nr:hypothetical protein [Myxococcales bacterium]